jgi:predicted RNase H-like HicB family nuclease
MNRYTVLIDGEPGAYGVVFPDLPGCTAMGDTIDAALIDAAGAARAWTRVAELHGEIVPAPRELAALRQDPEVVEALADGAALGTVALIREAGKSKVANLSLDAGILAAIDEAASRTKRTRSAMVEVLATTALPLVG